MTVTAYEFGQALEASPEREGYYELGSFINDFFWRKDTTINVLDGVVSHAAGGGGEGDGAPIWKVLKFERDGETQYFRLDGQYSSWDSTYWDDNLYEVYPAEVMVIDWKRL